MVKRLVLGATTGALVLLVVLLAVSAAGRVLARRLRLAGVHWSGSQEYVYDPLLGWRAAPRLDMAVAAHPPLPWGIRLQTNADGFRDIDWNDKLAAAAAQHARRTLILGDSFLYGWGSDQRDIFIAVAEEVGLGAETNAVLFNAGMSGYGFFHYARALEVLSPRVQPQETWVFVTMNDVGDAALPYDHRYAARVYKPFYDEEGRLVSETVPQRPSLALANSWIGFWSGLFVADAASYLAETTTLTLKGYPTELNCELHPASFDHLWSHPEVLHRFPRILRSIRAVLKDMRTKAIASGNQLRFIANSRAVNAGLQSLLDKGSEILDYPPVWDDVAPYMSHVNEGHPGWLWALLAVERISGHPLDGAVRARVFRSRLADRVSFRDPVAMKASVSGTLEVTPAKAYALPERPIFIKLLDPHSSNEKREICISYAVPGGPTRQARITSTDSAVVTTEGPKGISLRVLGGQRLPPALQGLLLLELRVTERLDLISLGVS